MQLEHLSLSYGQDPYKIAVLSQSGSSSQPGIFWLGGFMSDMQGTKAEFLATWAKRQNRNYVRFDYSGHGLSGGDFALGTIGGWLQEARSVFERYCCGSQVIVGSSMGGWLALLLMRSLQKKPLPHAAIAGLTLIAPAVDFTETLVWQQLPPEVQTEMINQGFWHLPNTYSEKGYLFTHQLITEGRNHLLLHQPIVCDVPVRILQGDQDEDVPWQHSVQLLSCLTTSDVIYTLVKGAGHSFSRPSDLELLQQSIASCG